MLIMIDDACTAIKHHVLLLSWTPFDGALLANLAIILRHMRWTSQTNSKWTDKSTIPYVGYI